MHIKITVVLKKKKKKEKIPNAKEKTISNYNYDRQKSTYET